MASLLGSSRTVNNATMRARVEAAVRATAAVKKGFDGAVGKLGTAALLNPEFVVSAFLVRVVVNPTVSASTCPDCGYATAEDGDLQYVVDSAWDEVAAAEFPTTPTE